MSNYEIVVPYVLHGRRERQLSMKVRAASAPEAIALAQSRAWIVRPLLGGPRVTAFGTPELVPRRAA